MLEVDILLDEIERKYLIACELLDLTLAQPHQEYFQDGIAVQRAEIKFLLETHEQVWGDERKRRQALGETWNRPHRMNPRND